jgi:hypothetical protein
MADHAGMMAVNRAVAALYAAAHRFEQLTDDLDPASVAAEDQSDLRAVAEAAEDRSAAMRPSLRPANRLFPQLIVITRPRLRRPGTAGSGPRIACGSQPTV